MFKWELVEENKLMIEYETILGMTFTHRVIVDVYRRKKLNGIYKYKYVKREP